MTEHNLLVFLVQVLVLLVLARGAGELLRRLGQAPIVGEILVGVLLGPTLLGRAFPELHASLFPPDAVQRSMLDVVSWFGVLFLLLETGLHVDVSAAWRARGPALRIGIIGVLVPCWWARRRSAARPRSRRPRPAHHLRPVPRHHDGDQRDGDHRPRAA